MSRARVSRRLRVLALLTPSREAPGRRASRLHREPFSVVEEDQTRICRSGSESQHRASRPMATWLNSAGLTPIIIATCSSMLARGPPALI